MSQNAATEMLPLLPPLPSVASSATSLLLQLYFGMVDLELHARFVPGQVLTPTPMGARSSARCTGVGWLMAPCLLACLQGPALWQVDRAVIDRTFVLKPPMDYRRLASFTQ